MLFGFLHRVTIAINDLKEAIIFMVLCSCQICKIMSNDADLLLFNLCSLNISAVFPIFVVLQPNLQGMLTIAQRTSTLHFVCLLYTSDAADE